MSAAFVPCSHCRRHVRVGDVCRYCDTRAPSSAPDVARGSRGAFLVATALVAASGGLGCKDDAGDKVTMDEPRRPKDPAVASAKESATSPSPTPAPSPSTTATDLALGDVDGGGLGLKGIGIGAAYGGPPPGPGLGTIGIPAPAAYGIAPPPPTITAPTGDVSTAPATVTGGVKNADSVIARNRWRFKACYNKALASDPTIAGKVTVRATLNADGEVTKSELVTTTVPATLASCIVAGPNAFKFDAGAGVSTVTFTVTLVQKPTP